MSVYIVSGIDDETDLNRFRLCADVLQIPFSSTHYKYTEMSANLEIKWNGKRFPIDFSSAKELEQTTVKELKQICGRITGVSPRDMKINAFGGKLCYGMRLQWQCIDSEQ